MRRGWVGLDVGTTSSKAVVYDDHGRQLGSARVPTVWTTAARHVEIDPDVLRAGALAAVNQAVAATPTDVEFAGIGLASMGETGVLVDRAGHPVAAAIAWHDPRDAAEVAALGDQIGRATFERRTGKPLRSQFSLTKHRWLLDHEPGTRAAVRRFNVAEWVARGLGADECCELSLAGRTGWYDLFRRTWDEELLAWSGANAALMPALVEAGVAIGTVVSSDAHPRLRGAVVTLAGHDHQSAAVGCGAENAGDELDSSGTAEALVRTVEPTLSPDQVERLTRAGITVDVSVQSGRWSLLGGTQGGLIMGRVLGLLGIDARRLSADVEGADDERVDASGVDAERVDAEGVDARGVDARGVDAEGVGVGGVDERGVDPRGDGAGGVNVGGVAARGVGGRGVNAGGHEAGGGDAGGAEARGVGARGVDAKGVGAGAVGARGLGPLDAAAIAVRAGAAQGVAVTIVDGTLEFSVTGDVTPAVLWRTVVDAVTSEAAALHETISAVAGPCTRIVAAGGWCASAMVMDAKRRLLGDVTLTEVAEPGAFGAAILAARAAGHLDPAGRLGPPVSSLNVDAP